MKYSASPDIFQCNDLAQVAWDAIAPIWDDLPFDRFNALAEFMEVLTEGQRGLIALDWCQKEIRNGGIKQLFVNSTGNLIPWAIAGFQLIGADKYATTLSKAAAMLGPDYPKSGNARRKAYGALSKSEKDEIEKLNEYFFALLNSQENDLERYRGNYVKNHKEQFIESYSE